MRILKILLVLLVILAAVFFIGGYLLPDRISVARSVDIARPPAQVFAVVNDLSRFNEWSPWYALDPKAEYRHEGPASGVGATLHWAGNDEVGKGTMRIVESTAPSHVATQVAFEGFPDPADAKFTIEPAGENGSRVTWAFTTALAGPVARWFGLLMPKYIGTDYERGLTQLKTLAESQPAVDFSDLNVRFEQVAPMDVIAIAGSAPAGDAAASAVVLGELYGELLAFAGERGLEIAGQPLTLTESFEDGPWRFEAALPIRAPAGAIEARAPIVVKQTQGGQALVVEHVGPYDQLAATLAKIDAYAAANGHRRNGPVQENYISDPGDTPPEALVTRIVYPVE